ncbi:MAG: DUF58 domain-containing protein, partial [Bacteroidia bacterium]
MYDKFKKIFRQLRLTKWFYRIIFGLILLFILSFIFSVIYDIAFVLLLLLIFTTSIDAYLLFKNPQPLNANRKSKFQRLSNGDVNELELQVQNFYPFKITFSAIDELPIQFQVR